MPSVSSRIRPIPMLASPHACSPCPLPINAMLSIEGLLNLSSWSLNENHNFGRLFLGWWVWAYSIFSELHIQMSMECIHEHLFENTTNMEVLMHGSFCFTMNSCGWKSYSSWMMKFGNEKTLLLSTIPVD